VYIQQAKTTIRFIFQPYFDRLRLGEGGLVGFNILCLYFSNHSLFEGVYLTLLSLLVLCTLYGYNDYCDRYKDLNNPKKNKVFCQLIIQNSRLYLIQNIILSTVCILFVAYLDSLFTLYIILALYAVNIFYSKKAKQTPLLDVLIVGIWGGLYVSIVGQQEWRLFIIAGLTTAIAHFFQIMTDEKTDAQNNVNTSAVFLKENSFVLLFLFCLLLGATVYQYIGIWWAQGAILPLISFLYSKHIYLSWYLARIYFVLLWIKLLILVYGNV